MENVYRINKLENNQVDSPNFQFGSDGVSYSLLNTDQNRSPINKSKLTGRWFKVHLIDDQNSTDKILVQLNLNQEDENKDKENKSTRVYKKYQLGGDYEIQNPYQYDPNFTVAQQNQIVTPPLNQLNAAKSQSAYQTQPSF